jgi:competence protein ComEA
MTSLKSILAPLLLSLVIAGSAFANEKVNINTADAATIERVLVNVGMAKAEAIVAHRKANGAFKSPEQLATVKGIGLKTVEKNRDRIVVGGGAARPAAAKASPAKGKGVAQR